MNKYIKALVKVTSQYEYAQNFRDGKLWMNELCFFTKCEQKELGDAKEARGTTFSFLNHTYHLINNQDLCRPIFCLYGVYDTKHGNTSFISIPEKMKAFGTYAVVVTDVEEFLNRLRRVPLIFSPIDYQELDLHDPNSKTPFRPYFHKGKYFKYQSEFRILDDRIYLTKNSPQKYESLATIDDDHNVIEIVNGLQDITSEILPIEEILNPNQCKVSLSVNWENLRFQDFVLYNNPRLAELQGMKK